jgi:hypothetical protein
MQGTIGNMKSKQLIQAFKEQLLLYIPPALTSKNTAFANTVFMCFILFSEEKQ